MKTLTKLSGILLTTAALCSFASAASANLVENGSFEDPGLDKSWDYFESIPGWTSLEGSTIEVRKNHIGKAFDGDHFVEIDSHNYTPDDEGNVGFFQDIVTKIGQKYKLSFVYSPRAQKKVNGDNLFTVIFGDIEEKLDAGNKGAGWQTFTNTITASSESTRLKFLLDGEFDTLGANVDYVHVEAVPEPLSLLGLAAIGAVGTVGAVRKRNAAQG